MFNVDWETHTNYLQYIQIHGESESNKAQKMD